MKEINHEYYASPELAKLLKEAGFDWKQYSFYNTKGILINGTFAANWNEKTWHIDGSKVSAPTLGVAERWLREVKGTEVNILCVYIKHIKKYSYTVFTKEYKHEIIEEGFDTYEEAQEAGEKKALELILEKMKENYDR